MQPEFDFAGLAGKSADGVALWRQEREAQQLELAKKLGLPIGQQVEVWLRGGVRLKGKLLLNEELVQPDAKSGLRLKVDGTGFSMDELESCTRT